MRYGMVIDLDKCSGCMCCDVACKRENFTPPGVHWSKVHIYETGKYPHTKLRSLPTLCMHCEEPACLKACPTGATSKRADGVVTIDNERCIGCGYCALACPYEARALNRTEPRPYHEPHDFTPFEKIGYFQKLGSVEHGKGVIEKCTFCFTVWSKEGSRRAWRPVRPAPECSETSMILRARWPSWSRKEPKGGWRSMVRSLKSSTFAWSSTWVENRKRTPTKLLKVRSRAQEGRSA